MKIEVLLDLMHGLYNTLFLLLWNIILKIYSFIYNTIVVFSKNISTYNLGVAISSFAIVVAFIEIISLKNNLKIKIHHKRKNLALLFASISVFLTLIAEFINNLFIFNIIAAIFMIVAIGVYLWLIYPIKNIKIKDVAKTKRILDGFILNKFTHGNSEIIKDLIVVYDDLLYMGLKNSEVAELFSRYFTSKVFLNYFSQSGYIFSKTLKFLLENNSHEVEYFFKRLFLISLNSEDSYLNIFINEDIYPNTLNDFDVALLNDNNIVILLDRLKFDIGYSLDVKGHISFLKIVERYFSLIHNFNKCTNFFKKENCKIKYQLNDSLVILFFDVIKEVLNSTYRANEIEKKEIIDKIGGVGGILHKYNYCINFQQKSKTIREKAGEILYELYEAILMNYDLCNKEKDFENEHLVRKLYHNLTDYGKDKIAQYVFLNKLKEKIIYDEYSSNAKGGYPPMILIYWYLFGSVIFGVHVVKDDLRDIHIEILSKLADSFPRLYDGYIRNFYNAKTLPVKKRKYLRERGKKILYDFLLSYMEYNRKENSLSYYFGFGDKISGGSKIFLDEVKKYRRIDIVKV